MAAKRRAAPTELPNDPIERLAMQVGELSTEIKYQRRFLREARQEIRKLSRQATAQRASIQQKDREIKSLRSMSQQTAAQLDELRSSLRWRVVNLLGQTGKNPVLLPRFPILMLSAISGSKMRTSLIVRTASRIERCIEILRSLSETIPRHSLATATYSAKMVAYVALGQD